MNKSKFKNIAIGLMAFTSCTSIAPNMHDNSQQDVEKTNKPNVVFFKNEGSNLADYTEEYRSHNFKISNGYIYKGEQLGSDEYIDSETYIYKTRVGQEKHVMLADHPDYNSFPDESNDEYKVSIREVNNPKHRLNSEEPKMIKEKTVSNENRKIVYVTLKSKDTGEEKEIAIRQGIEEIDPLDVVKKHYEESAKYSDLKKGLDHNRISLDVVAADDIKKPAANPFKGGFKLNKKEKENPLDKYKDLDDMVGEYNVKVRVRVDGFASERDQFIDKKVVFGDSIDKYNYEELLSDLSKSSLKFSKDGKEVLGGFDEYKMGRLLANSDTDKLTFRTRILDEDPSKPTVGNHKVVREIIRDGKVVYSKKDNAFVGFNGPTVLVTDNSFFDLEPEIEARTYRETPYYTDPKFDFQRSQSGAFAKVARTHGATVIGAMIDELSYGDSTFWRGILISNLGREGNKPKTTSNRNRLSDERIYELLNNALEQLITTYPDKVEFNNLVDEVRTKMNSSLKPAIEGKYKPFGKEEVILTEEQKKEKLKEFYDYIIKKGEEISYITEKEKIDYTDINFHVVSIGRKDGRGVLPEKSAQYIPKVLEKNKNIKLVNMSYGADHNFNDYINLVSMTDDAKERAAKAYNESPLYRFLIQSWLKKQKSEFNELMTKNYQEFFNAIDLYDYFKNKENITKEDFDKIIQFRKNIVEGNIRNARELSAANHDVLFIRSIGNTHNSARVDLTNFRSNGTKIFLEDPNYKYNNNLGSVPSVINYLAKKEADENGKAYKYDYSYRKNILTVVGLAYKGSFYGRDSTDDFGGYGLGTIGAQLIKQKAYSVGMIDNYLELVKELNAVKLNPEKYPEGYKKEIEDQIKAIERYSSINGAKSNIFSLTRAGDSKLWTVAAEGEYVYVTDKDNKGKDLPKGQNFEPVLGSSFAAPRVTAVAAKVQSIFPWMSAHQLKQTILTTARDDFRILQAPDGKRQLVGQYGVDEHIGWGILDRNKAFKGPARFVRALTHETGDENFVANVPYGVFEFSNNIAGGFDPVQHMVSRGKLTADDLDKIDKAANENEARQAYQDKIIDYVRSLPFEERELFADAGLVKSGKGTLVLSGNNTFNADTFVQEGTLVLRGTSKSSHYVSKGAKLKLDLNHANSRDTHGLSIDGDIENKGELYSYSNADTITKNYVPYKGSKTYVSTVSKLSIANLDLRETDRFEIDVFKSKGISRFISSFRKPSLIFEAKTAADSISKVRLGSFPISNKLTLTLSYKDNTLKGELSSGGFAKKAEDKRPGGNRPAFLDELEAKIKDKKDELDKQAEEREKKKNQVPGSVPPPPPAPSSNIPVPPPLPPVESKPVDSGNIPPAPPLPPVAIPPAPPLPVNFTSLSSTVLEDSLDAIAYSNVEDEYHMNGQSLADSLTMGAEVPSYKLDKLNDILSDGFRKDKASLFGGLINEFGIAKNDRDQLSYRSRLNGFYAGVGTKKKQTEYMLSVDYINGHTYKDYISTARFNSLGINLGINHKVGSNLSLKGVISHTSLFKKVIKDVLFADNKEHNQNQQTITFTGGFSYDLKVSDKVTLKHYADLDAYMFGFDKYDEKDSILGLKYDEQITFNANLKVGLDTKIKVNDKFGLDLTASYAKWLKDPKINLNVKSTLVEEAQNNVDSISFKDNIVRVGIKGTFKPTDKFSVDIKYSNRNISNNSIGLGMKYTF